MEVSLESLIPNKGENKYLYSNGLSKLIPRLTLKVHSKLDECHALWEELSPKKTLFDDWQFRYSWYEGYANKLFFYTIYDGKNPVALLPLGYDNSDKKRYEWFGTNWMEDNRFLVPDSHYIDLLYAILPTPIHLNALEGDFEETLIKDILKPDDPKNTKNISKFSSVEELVSSYDKKHRYSLKADYNFVSDLNPRIVETETTDSAYMDKLVEMNINQFKDRPGDESDLVIPKRVQTYKNILKNSGTYKTKFIEIYIQNRLAAIDFVITYKDVYYTIKGGIDVARFKGLSNFMVYYEFEDAIKNGFKTVDCLQIDYGWKHRFFDQRPTYLLEK